MQEPDLNNISLDSWDHPHFRLQDLKVDVLRLDKIHPDISGNKWFKLKYYLAKARQENKKTLISFGGAYSNHLLALAAAAGLEGFSSIGLIRGEEPPVLSHTLLAARDYGMSLQFLSRSEYDRKKKLATRNLTEDLYPEALLIAEGGAGEEGRRGAEEILSLIPTANYSHICTAAGTGTTLAGLLNSGGAAQKIIGVSVLKGTRDYEPLDVSWIKNPASLKNLLIVHDDHFGGYAKSSQTLFDFMNEVYTASGIPTDFVYTGKLFFSVVRLADRKAFQPGSRILVLHSGGLQGNRSLEAGELQF